MKKVFTLIVLIIYLIKAGLAQGTVPDLVSDSLCISDTSFMNKTPPTINEGKNNSVFDIFWVTNSIKSGWKPCDTIMIGTGLEACDTAFPFIMPVNGKLWRGYSYYHAGWDIGSDYGTPVKAGLGGRVRFAGYCSGYGKLVIVRHYSGLEMYYAHLSKIKVLTDQFIEPGDTIGLVGATGHARGSHLHMEFRLCDRALDIADYYTQDDTIVNLYRIKETSKKQTQPQTAEYHIVVRGETLSGIASRYGTTVTNLCTLNHINRNSVLRIGQRLRIS